MFPYQAEKDIPEYLKYEMQYESTQSLSSQEEEKFSENNSPACFTPKFEKAVLNPEDFLAKKEVVYRYEPSSPLLNKSQHAKMDS